MTDMSPQDPGKPERPQFQIWTIHERPADYPSGYLVRVAVVHAGVVFTLPIALAFPSIEDARLSIPRGLLNIGRDPNDAPTIKEVWI